MNYSHEFHKEQLFMSKKQLQKITVLLAFLLLQVIPSVHEELFWVFNDKG